MESLLFLSKAKRNRREVGVIAGDQSLEGSGEFAPYQHACLLPVQERQGRPHSLVDVGGVVAAGVSLVVDERAQSVHRRSSNLPRHNQICSITITRPTHLGVAVAQQLVEALVSLVADSAPSCLL